MQIVQHLGEGIGRQLGNRVRQDQRQIAVHQSHPRGSSFHS